MNKEIKLTKQQMVDLLYNHKCPKCGGYDIIFYNPNMLDDDETVQTEFECNECSLYLILNFGFQKVWRYGGQGIEPNDTTFNGIKREEYF